MTEENFLKFDKDAYEFILTGHNCAEQGATVGVDYSRLEDRVLAQAHMTKDWEDHARIKLDAPPRVSVTGRTASAPEIGDFHFTPNLNASWGPGQAVVTKDMETVFVDITGPVKSHSLDAMATYYMNKRNGEIGPEAVMPLHKDSQSRLGVPVKITGIDLSSSPDVTRRVHRSTGVNGCVTRRYSCTKPNPPYFPKSFEVSGEMEVTFTDTKLYEEVSSKQGEWEDTILRVAQAAGANAGLIESQIEGLTQAGVTEEELRTELGEEKRKPQKTDRVLLDNPHEPVTDAQGNAVNM